MSDVIWSPVSREERGSLDSVHLERKSTVMDIRCLDDASYVLGALTPAEERAFLQHLQRCPTCRISVARLEQLPWLPVLTILPSIGVPEG